MAKTKADFIAEGRASYNHPLRVRGSITDTTMPLFGLGKSWQAKAFAEGWKAAHLEKKYNDQCAEIVAATDVIQCDIDSFIEGYLVAALWSSSDTLPGTEEGQEGETVNLDNYDWANGQEAKLTGDCLDFIQGNAADLLQYEQEKSHAPGYGAWECAGHDFWLTRNGHGAGFWDRGLGELGKRLTEACKTFGGVDLYLGDDEQVYASGQEG